VRVVGYPQPGKAKSRVVLDAFAQGCKGSVRISPASILEPGAAAFFGLVGIEHLLRLARAESRTFFYGDNSFFDVSRGKFFRFAKNAFQIESPAAPDYDRARALNLIVEPWRKDGEHILIIEQSAHFMKLSGQHPLWSARVIAELRQHTDRPLRLRCWNRNKEKAGASLTSDLKGAWAVVTYASAAANEALLAGVPVFVYAKQCAAATMASGSLSSIESPRYPEGREDWAAGLAAMQWTLDELKEGKAWTVLG
jgi:hypothetical protein